jgi:hypothetical protein
VTRKDGGVQTPERRWRTSMVLEEALREDEAGVRWVILVGTKNLDPLAGWRRCFGSLDTNQMVDRLATD